MKRILCLLLCLLCLLTACGDPDPSESTSATAAQIAMRSMLAVTYTEELPQQPVPITSQSFGSAVVWEITQDGGAYLATNYHVIAPTSDGQNGTIRVFPCGQEQGEGVQAQLLWTCQNYDLALLYAPSLTSVFPGAQAVTLATSAPLGTAVLALGNCKGAGLSARSGILSRVVQCETIPVSYQAQELVLPVCRFDAMVDKGDSGGGLFTSDGKFVGLIQSRRTDTGEGYALMAAHVTALMQKAIASAKESPTAVRVSVLDLGVSVREQMGYHPQTGQTTYTHQTKVQKVRNGSLASLFLQEGDLLLSVEGAFESDLSRAHLLDLLCLSAKEGDALTVRYLRNGQTLSYSFNVSSHYLTQG